jgi:hypothetical protein
MKSPFEITVSRRAFMKAALGAAAGAALEPRRAFAAEFTLKLATARRTRSTIHVSGMARVRS